MREQVISVMKKYNMLEKGDKVVIGVSGGADSVALLAMLNDLRKEMALTLFVVHVNHGIRGNEAKRDEDFVINLCNSMDIQCQVKSYDVPSLAKKWSMTEEEAGRKVRYDAFNECLEDKQANKIAVAHNLNDQAETVLMRLCRGTGLTGLGGIPPKRDNIIRPLIECSRNQIEQWLEEKNIEFCMDSTNMETDYTRNKIRLEILPYLEKEINSKSIQNIVKTAQIVREEDQFIESETETMFKTALYTSTSYEVLLKIDVVLGASRVIQRRLIRKALKTIDKNVKDISFSHIEAVINLMNGESGKKINLSQGFFAEKEYNFLRLQKGEAEPQKDFCYELREEQVIYMAEVKKYAKMTRNIDNCKENDDLTYTKCFDCDKMNVVLKIRNRKSSDVVSINKNGGNKKLKDFFIDEKIPRTLRDRLPLLTCDNNVLWIIGHRVGSYYEADEKTERKLYVQVWEARND